MVQILNKVPTFAEQFSQSIGSGLSQGLTNVPELAMKLAAQKRERQGELAQTAQQMLQAHMPDATAAQLGDIASKVQNLRGSPGDIQKQLADIITQETNKVGRLKSTHGGAGLINTIKELVKEGYSPTESERIKEAALASKDVDKVKAREILAKKGFHAEARERALSSLEPSVHKMIQQLPKQTSKWKALFAGEGKGKFLQKTEGASTRANEIRKDQITQNLQQVLSAHPNANLVLLRKEYEKRGVDWRDFKDAISSIEEQGLINLSDEQKSMIKDITRPPLDRLEKALRRMKLVRQ